MTQIITSRWGWQWWWGGGGDWDMKKAVYDPQNIGKDAFDYDNFTNTPTIPTEVSELDNDAWYITSAALSGYQTTSNLVTNLTNPDDTHYPSAKAVSDAITSSGGWDMLKSVYDPDNIEANAFDYNNFINTPTIPTESNTKTFTLSSTSDLATAQAAYDWYRNWNNPIILYTNNIYILSWVSSGFVYFVANNEMWGTMWNSRSTVSISTVTFQKDWNTIEAISTTSKYSFNFIETDKNYSTAYTPQYNGSPATKKYVDDTAGWKVSDTAYGSGWDGVTWVAPSKNAVYDKINSIDWLIPSAATSSNKLTDKNYVDDSINSVTAYYITKNAAWDQWASYAELAAATTFYSWGVVRVPTRNDYTIVLDDENHDHATTRYIYNTNWEYQYTVNETPLTTAQMNALNSWITSTKVWQYDTAVTTIWWYGDIVTHDASEFATSAQWGLADTALQPNDNVSELVNDAWYLTTAPVTSVNWQTWAVTISEGNTKTFYASVPADWNTTLWQQIYDWIKDGNYAILQYWIQNVVIFTSTSTTTWNIYSQAYYIVRDNGDELESVATTYSITVSSWTVTAVSSHPTISSVWDFFAPWNAWTTDQVLTKTAGGYEWAEASGGWDAKVFEISWLTGSTNLATATQAYTYAYTNNWNIKINNFKLKCNSYYSKLELY